MDIDHPLLLQSIREAILLLDADGYISYANQATMTLTGFTAPELLNQHFSLLYPDRQDVLKREYELSQAQKKGTFIDQSWKIKKDGTLFWGELSLWPVYDARQLLAGFSILLRDNSEKKKRELEAQEREMRYRLLVEGMKDYAIFLLDPQGRIMTWNEGGQRLKGYSAPEIIGKNFSVFYQSSELEKRQPERELKHAQETGKYEGEGWRVKKNGSVFWAHQLITALYNEQNQLIGFSKVTRDLTEYKEREEILRQSEERYRLLVEQVTDYAIFMLDEKGKIISWNEGARRIKGYSAEEIIGKYFSIFYPEEDIQAGKPPTELRIASTEGKYEEEGWRIRRDGSRFWATVVITAVYNTQQVLIGFSKVTRDLTERKAGEKALRDSHDRYRRLTRELEGITTELSFKNQELEQFTSIVSHDLQEPVRTIKSFLTLIERKLDATADEALWGYIQKALLTANRMRELIQYLLHYTQLGKEELAIQTVSFQELVQQAMQNLKTALESSGAEISVETEVDVLTGDPVQLVQLIQNLLSNALKFMDTQPPRIHIGCTQTEGQIQVAIKDNGIGIAQENLTKIFEIFRRLHTKQKYEGTGIGLAICKKIVDRHGGRIWPESEPGQGTTFYFTLPARSTLNQVTL
ncbi:PAS domain-containing sensor histidine kinase [Rhabdobacter roseus]|uniref:histidine kinase n=1 Tax=Rhabdobacter roseus TaxID=1655419 RepID=A0A840TIN4_9BACT|nr:PAS domain S-box protein [Rhabdobacter roseus]MBB5284036.1 PAS domain S-box-containing protein [Rhabdobacter roseus]